MIGLFEQVKLGDVVRFDGASHTMVVEEFFGWALGCVWIDDAGKVRRSAVLRSDLTLIRKPEADRAN